MVSKEQLKAIHAKADILIKKGVKAYDVKSKMMANMENPKLVEMKNGRWALKGTSEKSGIKIQRIIG